MTTSLPRGVMGPVPKDELVNKHLGLYSPQSQTLETSDTILSATAEAICHYQCQLSYYYKTSQFQHNWSIIKVFKTNFMNMIEDLKEEMNKYMKDTEKRAN